jgi:hypothetical protein
MSEQAVSFWYVNWRGEGAIRHVIPGSIIFMQTKWHPEPQWVLHAFDIQKKEHRHFAMKDITGWTPSVLVENQPRPRLPFRLPSPLHDDDDVPNDWDTHNW